MRKKDGHVSSMYWITNSQFFHLIAPFQKDELQKVFIFICLITLAHELKETLMIFFDLPLTLLYYQSLHWHVFAITLEVRCHFGAIKIIALTCTKLENHHLIFG